MGCESDFLGVTPPSVEYNNAMHAVIIVFTADTSLN